DETALAVELVELVPQNDGGLLKQVIGVVKVAHQAVEGAVQLRLMLPQVFGELCFAMLIVFHEGSSPSHLNRFLVPICNEKWRKLLDYIGRLGYDTRLSARHRLFVMRLKELSHGLSTDQHGKKLPGMKHSVNCRTSQGLFQLPCLFRVDP